MGNWSKRDSGCVPSDDREVFIKDNAVAMVEDRDALVARLRGELARLNKRAKAYKDQNAILVERLADSETQFEEAAAIMHESDRLRVKNARLQRDLDAAIETMADRDMPNSIRQILMTAADAVRKKAVADMRERCAAKLIESADALAEQAKQQTDPAWGEVYKHKAVALKKAAYVIVTLPLERP